MKLLPEPLLTSAGLGLHLQPLFTDQLRRTHEHSNRELVAMVVFGWLLLKGLSEVVTKPKRENRQGSY